MTDRGEPLAGEDTSALRPIREGPSALPLAAIVAVVALGHLSLFPNIADLDGFYHIGHAKAYLDGSLLDTALPWASFSIIGSTGGDLWWGFHVLLIPFAWIGSVAAAVRVVALLLTLGLGLTVFWVLRRHEVAWAGVWAAVFLIAVPNVFFRHLMVRPHVISLAASVALLSVLVRGRWWQVLLLSTLMSWVHLSLFWMAPCIAVAYGVVRIPVTVALQPEAPDTGVPIRWAVTCATIGSFLGWLLRPDPLAAASLLNVQLVQLFAQKATDQPLTFAAELAPLGVAELVRTSWTFAIAWVVGGAAILVLAAKGRFQKLGQARATLLLTALAISVVFLALALLSARRAMEQWVSFGIVSLALLSVLVPLKKPTGFRTGAFTAALATLLVAHAVWGWSRQQLNVAEVAFPGSTMMEVALFLEDNADPDALVFHTRWDNFGPLFAHNRSQRYLGGMDPIFQFAFDARPYWEFFYLSADITTEWTCDAYPCETGNATDTHVVLRDHFGAEWVVVEPSRNPRFALYLLNDARYRLALETQSEALFEILDPEEGD